MVLVGVSRTLLVIIQLHVFLVFGYFLNAYLVYAYTLYVYMNMHICITHLYVLAYLYTHFMVKIKSFVLL